MNSKQKGVQSDSDLQKLTYEKHTTDPYRYPDLEEYKWVGLDIFMKLKLDKKVKNKDKTDPDILEKAIRIAAVAHKAQIRKGDGLPYIIHPVAVAMRLARQGFPDAVVAAALVHDVLEDTDYPEAKMREEVGEEVVAIVKAVTNDGALPWDEKKMKYAGAGDLEKVQPGPLLERLKQLR